LAGFRPGTPDQLDFLTDLIAGGLLIESGVPGVYGRGSGFEDIRLRFDELVSRAAELEGAERLRFPPVLPRRQVEATGYLKSFPHLVGSVFAFEGSEAQAVEQQGRVSRNEDWSEFQSMTELMLVPAACYPVYPAIAAREPIPPGGVMLDLGGSYVFRNEPAGDPARLQIFHQREVVRIGEPELVLAWRNAWRDRTLELLRAVGLEAETDVASDPFFGRGGRMLSAGQLEQALKFEVQVQIAGPEPTAVASFNYHEAHFTSTFGIRSAAGSVVHSACLGIGLERVVLALLRAHGLETAQWPKVVRRELRMDRADRLRSPGC
jgi:seryl-tRNA synthetase